MDQCLHLLVVDPRDDLILIDWHQGRWLLPVFGSRERTRIGPVAQRLAARRGIAGQVVGQWLGRMSESPDVVDWVVVVRTSAASVDPGDSTWVSPRVLAAADPVVEYQRWALEKMHAGRRGLGVPGPFGHPDWIDAVLAWVASKAGTVTSHEIVTYRTTAHAIVMMLPTSIGPLYFKGLATADEAALTIALSNLAPASFARTHAVERGPQGETWWLMRACPGSTLSSDPTVERAILVARECGRLQRRLPAAVLDRLAPVDSARAAAWSVAMLQSLGTSPEIDRCCDLIQTACADVAHARDAGRVDSTRSRSGQRDPRRRTGPLHRSRRVLLRSGAAGGGHVRAPAQAPDIRRCAPPVSSDPFTRLASKASGWHRLADDCGGRSSSSRWCWRWSPVGDRS